MLKLEKNIVAPFCVFFIVMGAGGIILLPMAHAAFNFSEKQYQLLFNTAWYIGAVLAFFYSTIVLRGYLREGFVERVLYWFMAVIFIALLFVPYYR